MVKTAIQIEIEKIEQRVRELIQDYKIHQVISDHKAMDEIRIKKDELELVLKSLIEARDTTEKDQICTAYDVGYDDNEPGIAYYNRTYK